MLLDVLSLLVAVGSANAAAVVNVGGSTIVGTEFKPSNVEFFGGKC